MFYDSYSKFAEGSQHTFIQIDTKKNILEKYIYILQMSVRKRKEKLVFKRDLHSAKKNLTVAKICRFLLDMYMYKSKGNE